MSHTPAPVVAEVEAPRPIPSTTVSEGGRPKMEQQAAAVVKKSMQDPSRKRVKAEKRTDVAKKELQVIPLPMSTPKRSVDRKRTRDDEPQGEAIASNSSVVLNELDDYRNECLKLEKVRHTRVYEADKRRLYHENVILTMYEMEVAAIMEDFEQTKRAAVHKMLMDNAEKMRQVDELRYGICKDDWQRRHDMALRRRSGIDDELDEGRPSNRRKRTRSNSVKVNVELDDHQVSDDLAEMRGEKRQREEGTERDRRSKKRK